MRIIFILAVAAGAIWAAKTGKFKKSKLDSLRDRAVDIAGSATDDLGKRAEDVADRVRSATH